MSEVTRL